MSNIIPHESPERLAERPTAGMAALLTARPELGKGLAKAIAAAHSVEKAATNKFHNYDYASSDGIIEAARQPLAEAGLSLIPIEASLNGSEREGPDRFELVRTFLLLHASGESLPLRVTWPVVPDKGRPLDKATAAADTLSLSYLLRDLLLLPRVDKALEVHARDDRPQQERPPKPAKKRGNLPANGLELLARLGKREAVLVEAGRCKGNELMEYIRRQGLAAGHGNIVGNWNDLAIAQSVEWCKDFEAAHAAPNGTTAPQKISLADLQALNDLLAQKGRTWALLASSLKLPQTARPLDLTSPQYADAMRMLNEEPDRPEPARK